MSEISQELKRNLKAIQNLKVDELARREDLGKSLNFEAAKEPAQNIVNLFKMIPVEDIGLLPDTMKNSINQQVIVIADIISQIIGFDVDEQENPADARTVLIAQLNDVYEQTFHNIYTQIAFLGAQSRDTSKLKDELNNLLSNTKNSSEELLIKIESNSQKSEELLQSMRTAAAEQGVSKEASFFKKESEKHDKSALKWALLTFFFVATFAALAATTFFFRNSPLFVVTSTPDAINLVVSKLIVFSALGYALFLSARNFMANRHNAIVNKHRQNALLTFKALVNAAKGEERQDIILEQAAKCIYAPLETGYAKQVNSNPGSGMHTLLRLLPGVSGGHSGS
ncbi:MAG: hypothetical protein COA84_12680 [Robiginitomaculum sp.]|nr:MAG: hypothetical protein COA84_12680 [Robiginitomaculum sp.]